MCQPSSANKPTVPYNTGIWHCYWEYDHLQGTPGSDLTIYDIGFQTDFRVYLQLRQTWLAFMIILCIVEVFIILMLIFLRNRIRIAIALLQEGSSFLSTSGEPVYKVMANQTLCKYANLTCDPETFNTTNVTKLCVGAQCTFAFYGGESFYHKYIFIFQLSNAFVFLWLVNFAIALGQCTLAGAFASYYWAFRKPADIPPCPLFSSFGRAIRYHTGSLAFGSLILAIVQLIRIILEYLDHKLKGTQNSCTRFLLCCLKCCFWCLEKFIKFINRNAYIMIAIYGKNFCTSAKEAFFLLMRNVVRVAVLDKVTDFLLFLGKLLVAGGVGVLAFFFFTHRIPVFTQETPTLNYYWVPLLGCCPPRHAGSSMAGARHYRKWDALALRCLQKAAPPCRAAAAAQARQSQQALSQMFILEYSGDSPMEWVNG
ncbi:Choline transporter-like protein 5 [Chelonia mydas]|uniref:Choline transporter-like protein n=1 Tax=Chelonia mydas TaxID=8469 RepID=M7B7U6_CHEMY|nr:Choline transporter-like protein 5 [Chelonia mydas]